MLVRLCVRVYMLVCAWLQSRGISLLLLLVSFACLLSVCVLCFVWFLRSVCVCLFGVVHVCVLVCVNAFGCLVFCVIMCLWCL